MIYLDHHAATPLSALVMEAMSRAQASAWANPESVHGQGRVARAARENARAQLASALGAKPADLVLAGSGTEALNLAILGLARARSGAGYLLTTSIEHPAVTASAAQLAREGLPTRWLELAEGVPFTAQQLREQLTPKAACVAVQWVNHETGTILPVAEYASVCRELGVPLVVDASQAFGKLPIDVTSLGASAVVVASAKIGGPSGASALWHERCTELAPVLYGGAQERGFRPGTPDVPSLAGFGAAASQLGQRLASMPQVARLRDRIERAACELGAQVNGLAGERVATVSNLSFSGWRGDVLVAALDVEGLCVSAGAACSSGLGAPSPVLLAMYPDQKWRAESAIRISLGPETSEVDIEQACQRLSKVLGRVART